MAAGVLPLLGPSWDDIDRGSRSTGVTGPRVTREGTVGMPAKDYLDEVHLRIPVREFLHQVEVGGPTLYEDIISLAGHWRKLAEQGQ